MKKGLIFIVIVLTCQAGIAGAKVNINTATAVELQTLPRIGPGLAQSIVDYRNAHGPFKSIHDITKVPRIGEKTFQAIENLITVGDAGKTRHRKPAPTGIPAQKSGAAYEPIVKYTPTPRPTATPEPSMSEILAHFTSEPTIHDIQQAAIRYAEINPERFMNWRRDVKNQALLPESVQVKVKHDTDDDTDYSRSKTISVSGGTVTLGPDDETWGHDTDDDWTYEVSMKWKLREYLFNKEMLRVSSETSDQVELRQDILNEVTKLYFDRRRLQVDMILDPNVDIKTRLNREIKLQELTAAIDALTGGYLSNALAKSSKAPGRD